MGNKTKIRSQQAGKGAHEDAPATTDKPSFLTGGASIDPTLASLFETSVSPPDNNHRSDRWLHTRGDYQVLAVVRGRPLLTRLLL